MRGHDDGRGFHDVRPLEHRQFPGIPENVTGIVRRHEPGVLLDETERQPATFQGIRRSFPHLAAAEDKHGRPVRLAAPLGLAVISLKLIRRPREQQDGGLVDPAVRARGHIGIALPQPGHVEAEAFAEPALAQRLPHELGVDDRRLGKAQRPEPGDDVRLGAGPVDAAGKAPPKHLGHRVDVVAPRQPEDVRGLRILRTGGEQGRRRDFSHRGGDVRIPQIPFERCDQRRLVRPQVPVGVGVVELAGHHIIAVVVQFQRVLPVRYRDDIRVVVLPELAGHAQRDVVVAHQNRVAAGVGRQGARLALVVVFLDPRLVHETDERKRHHDHDENDTRHQHDDGEQFPDIAREGDVPEPQRGHDGQRPVDAGDIRIIPPFVGHDLMKHDAEQRHQNGREQQEADHDALIAASRGLGQERREKGQEQFHGQRP